MPKQSWKPSTQLHPVPVVMVTCVRPRERPNIITIAWVGTVCSEPPMLSISVRPERFSHDIIRDTGEFVVNVPSVPQVRAVDYCGVASGRDGDKFAHTGLKPVPAVKVGAPLLAECPLCLECRVRSSQLLGSHTLFVAEIVMVHADDTLLTGSGRFAIEKAGLIAYAHGHYYALGASLGHFGFSVRKHPPPRGGRHPRGKG